MPMTFDFFRERYCLFFLILRAKTLVLPFCFTAFTVHRDTYTPFPVWYDIQRPTGVLYRILITFEREELVLPTKRFFSLLRFLPALVYTEEVHTRLCVRR